MFKNDSQAGIFKMVAQRFCCTNLSHHTRLTGMRSCGPEISCLVDRCYFRFFALHRLMADWILLSFFQSLSLGTNLRKSTKQFYATPQVVSRLLTTAWSARGVSKAALKFDSVHRDTVPHSTYGKNPLPSLLRECGDMLSEVVPTGNNDPGSSEPSSSTLSIAGGS